ncbi:WbqC family protein [Cytophagales bacterium LB-30]|uniref:WbqC family protein n=1 Tax=Shiella aurantiaca TaxID=3058365 RepID=A0ABT8F8T1_9BACT|nr:WbqC family protein [Shiella aurantiaca]MDN4166356.1 WbqC family protein [Shiella aurantiaca]
MKKLLVDMHYLPSLAYLSQWVEAEEVILEKQEHFVKQTYRNRCYILGANGVQVLSVPVVGGSKKVAMGEVMIDYKQRWAMEHWRSIQSAYGKAPFFEFFADDFRKIYESKPATLWHLNAELLTLCLKILRLSPVLSFTEKYEKEIPDSIIDLRGRYLTQNQGKQQAGYTPVRYRQIFGNNFVSDLSIIDLIFCTGSEAKNILKQSLA